MSKGIRATIIEELGTISVNELQIAIDAIHDRREALAVETRRARLRMEVLRCAYEFEKWSQESGLGLTYSTFCDDFGYEPLPDTQDIFSRRSIYDRVKHIRSNLLGLFS